MTPTRSILEAALEGFAIQKAKIDAKCEEIREALKSPVEVMAQVTSVTGPRESTASFWRKMLKTEGGSVVDVTSLGDRWPPKKRKMSAAGRAAISAATKKRWAKYRKEQKRA